jgi:hypothetical protein
LAFVMGGSKWRGIFLGLAFVLAMVAPACASATTGAIEGATVEPSLAHASIQNLSVGYDGCSAAGNPTCSWNASAWLVAPLATSCPPDGSWSLMYEAHPPGLPIPGAPPSLGARRIWRLESTGDGTVHSGPLQLNLEGVDDQYLCLYATRQPVTSTYTSEPPDPSDLLASQLLHVDQPLKAPSTLPVDVEMGASGGTIPAALPRSKAVPVTLRVGFTSTETSTHTAPELTRIAIDVSRNVSFQTAGLPSCPIAELYSSAASARQACLGSLVGHGSVDSEVTLPGQSSVAIAGKLLAFYAFAEGQPRILAQVTSSGALPLTYVIPFGIEKAHGAFGTSLVVPKMSDSHISKLDLSLRRRFTHAGKSESFVSATCPARGRQSFASLQFGVSLRYDLGSSLGGESATVLRRCKVSAG